MALKLHCIFDSPSVLPDIVKLVEKTAHSLNGKKKSAKVEDVYAELMDQGFEIDAESIAFAYSNVNGIINRKGFSTTADLNRFGGASMKAAIEMANKGGLRKSRLGKASLSTSVATTVANTFATLKNRSDVDKTKLFLLQEALKKAASSKLNRGNVTNKQTKETFSETLQRYFALEDVGAANDEAMKGRVTGMASSMDAIWDAVKEDVEKISKGIKNKAERAEFDNMTEALRNSSYDILLSTTQADNVIKQILTDIGYTREIKVKGQPRQIVDWNKVLETSKDWKDEFGNRLEQSGFTPAQVDRVITRLQGNFDALIAAKSKAAMEKISAAKNLARKPDPNAIDRLVKLKNAGIFDANNAQYLREAFGADIPQDVADEVRQIVEDYNKNINKTGNLSNVEAESVIASIRNLLEPLNKTASEKVVDGFSDYLALRAGATISTSFNAMQNMSSGLGAAILPTITAVIRTRNPKIAYQFAKTWLDTFRDVARGGVTIRDAQTINVLDQLQGRGGLADRWNFDNAKGFFGYVRAVLTTLGQVTATAADAANGTVIYNAEIVQAVKAVLKAKNISNPNRVIDDIIFGKSGTFDSNGKELTNRQVWNEEANRRLANQAGVAERGTKARRIADELIWHKLVTDYGISIDDVKAIQTASLNQKSKNLGHESDVVVSPSVLLSYMSKAFSEAAVSAKNKDNRGEFLMWNMLNTTFRGLNMFIGGKGNWAILAMQHSPFGVVLAGADVLRQELLKGKTVPLWRQQLSLDGDPNKLIEQLSAQKALKARMERGIYGTIIQGIATWAIMNMMGSEDDDEEEDRIERMLSLFEEYYQDPNTKRFLDKALPLTLASELAYAYDKKTNQLDPEKISKIPILSKYFHGFGEAAGYFKKQVFSETSIDKLNTAYGYNDKIKDKEDQAMANAEATWKFVGEFFQIPYTAWYKIETNEMKVYKSGVTPDPDEKERVSDQFKDDLENIDGSIDAFIYGLGISNLVDRFKGE